MSVLNGLLTYGDSAIKEDVVLNAVEILTAQENQVQASLGKTRAINMVHSFLTDTLNRIKGVYKLLLIDLDAEMLTGANL